MADAAAGAARPGPAWWAERGILDNAAEADDFAVVAQGQVKWMADRAAAGFAEAGALAGGFGIRAAYLVASFSPSNNAMPAALGQVRATAEPFWRRLGELGLCEPPAWLDAAGDDFAVANVGQAKAAFSFALPPTPDPDADADGDGMLNGWEIAHGLDPYAAADAAGDVDGDGLSNFEESQFGTDPRATDTDGDGLSDVEEAGTVAVERKFMWLDLSGAENLLAGRIESDAASWTLPLSAPVAINGVDYTNAYVCLDGTVHLLCPTNTSGWAVERSNYGGLGGSQWSGMHITVAICATDLYARPEDWGSRVRMGCAESGGRTFTVVEYSDVGLRGTDARAAFQLILPHDETNAVYVSYLRVSGEIRSAAPVAGVQCGWMQSFRGWDQVYNVSWPAGLPPDATTVRYSIGTGTDPCAVDTDDDGFSDFDEATGFRSDPLSEDTDGDGLSDAEEAGLGTNPRCVDTDGDGMPDLWEALHHLCPRRDDAAEDLDGDGVSDRIEVERGADPANPSDGGVAPPPERTRTLTFNVFGDFAAWEMQVEGLGPGDTRVRRISMASPNASEAETLEMRKGSSYRLTMRWLNCNGHNGDRDAPWYCWQAKVDGHPDERTYDNYSSKRREGVAETVAGNGWIAKNADGLLTSHVDECARRGGNVAGGLSATLHVLDNPRIVPDYNRDGKIDQDDETVCDSESAAFWFWVNDDDDHADVNEGVKDRPGEGVNFRDNRVNGRGDLLDFTPMLLDVSTAFPPEMPYDIRTGVVWRLESSVVNAVWTSLDAENAGAFHRTNCGAAFGTALSQEARRAAVAHLSDDEDLSRSFAERMNASGGRGVVMVEGCRKGAGLSLAGRFGDYETPVAKGELDIQILPVGEMYRYVTLRDAHESTNFTVRIPGACSNFMARCADADVFFTYGFNVSEEEARAWGAETFKRLWQSGSNARFWAATWSGDYNWLGKAFNALHYHQDVYQALRTGAAFKAFVEEAQHDPSKRVLMAHSLGNMVVCEALRRGMAAGKYFMLNAAVASEAFDDPLQSVDAAIRSKYVPSDWDGYDSLAWAANWHKWFKDDSSDMRGRMGWPDYFKLVLENAAEVYNYYSSGDPIFLETGDDPGLTTGVFHWPTFRSEWDFVDFNVMFEAHCWQKQETHKGVEPIAGTIAGGWGFNCWTSLLPDVLQPAFYSADEANEAVASGAVTNKSVFHCGGTPMGNRNATSNDIYLSLAKYVPAVSSPIGGGPLCITEGKSVDLNVDENSAEVIPRPNGWGRDGGVHRQSWLHSDMKDMAYFYVYELYEQLVIKGALK